MAKKAKLFNNTPIRAIWVEEDQDWYYSITDAVVFFTNTLDPKGYISYIKNGNPYFAKHWNTISKPLVVPNKYGEKCRIMMANSYGILRIIVELPAVLSTPTKLLASLYASNRLRYVEKVEIPPQYPFPGFNTDK